MSGPAQINLTVPFTVQTQFTESNIQKIEHNILSHPVHLDH